jgi:O-6-methylguanine DNA methyltransferase
MQEEEQALRAAFAAVPAPPSLFPDVMDSVRRAQQAREALRALAPRLSVEASGQGVTRVRLARPGEASPPASGSAARWVARARRELVEYLEGRRAFFDVPWDSAVLGEFQGRVLGITARIPFGEVRSYGWIAKAIGDPAAARAVGTALATNPVPLIIPCHRVVKSDGSLGGYSFPGMRKAWLLDLEGSVTSLVGCTSTRIYCRRGCPHDLRVREENRLPFASIAEAKAQGYRACMICKPG